VTSSAGAKAFKSQSRILHLEEKREKWACSQWQTAILLVFNELAWQHCIKFLYFFCLQVKISLSLGGMIHHI